MDIKRFGNRQGKTIMLLHGNLMCWRQFENLIPLLEKKLCVYAVSFDGFDGTGETTYTTAQAQADKLAPTVLFRVGPGRSAGANDAFMDQIASILSRNLGCAKEDVRAYVLDNEEGHHFCIGGKHKDFSKKVK